MKQLAPSSSATESSITDSFRIPAPKDYHLFSATLRPHHNISFLNNRILCRTFKSPSSKVACTSSYKRWNSCDKLKLKVVKRRKKMSGEEGRRLKRMKLLADRKMRQIEKWCRMVKGWKCMMGLWRCVVARGTETCLNIWESVWQVENLNKI